MNSDKPLVSVFMITYNHEKYIAQAIESALMQKTDFNYEIVIGEDCSTDRTREIVVDYANRYPEIIKPILHENNVGAKANSESVRKACIGKYVAILEGDDYWIDPLKLQKQVDFLESHPHFSVCFTRAVDVDEEGNCLKKTSPSLFFKGVTSTRDILKMNFITTATCMYSHRANTEIPEFAKRFWAGDWVLHIFNSLGGKIGFIREVTSARRITSHGMSSTTHYLEKVLGKSGLIELLTALDSFFNHKYSRQIRSRVSYEYASLALYFAKRGNFRESTRNIKKSFKESFFNIPFCVPRLRICLGVLLNCCRNKR
ncbi:MAG TPA: glycosyltransferase [Mesotoga sp.]|nr:glycosyltransferase [Mesotoga sp.]